MITTHKLTCGCCGSPATATMDGETFQRAECEKGCTILSMPKDVHAELVRRVREGGRTVMNKDQPLLDLIMSQLPQVSRDNPIVVDAYRRLTEALRADA